IGPLLITISSYIAPFVEFLKDVGLKFPDLVAYIYEGVMAIFDAKDKMLADDRNPKEVEEEIVAQREKLVTDTLDKFHGSGPQVTTQLVRGTIEAIVAVVKADRYGYEDVLAKETKARALGYLKSPDLEKAYEAYPQLFGQRK
ncbi:MAG: hypothetical protein ACREN0_02040, partial [Thermodesulfobacteriota bacterium]